MLSAVFVDYDNIYLSLKRKSEEAARRFAKNSGAWMKAIENGQLITSAGVASAHLKRRLVMNRCYGNPVPRRNQGDNSTDMNSFPFVRHHFLRSGYEIIDCPPLTQQLKNSSDIRMVMDVRDFLTHETYFDEFMILSSDADFTPLLHRLRAHARRTVIFTNDNTASPYSALSDGEVRESDLIELLLDVADEDKASSGGSSSGGEEVGRKQIVDEVVRTVLAAPSPQPLEVLAERATRVLGHDTTIGTNWAGAGSFKKLLLTGLPSSVKITDEEPFLVYDANRTLAQPVARALPVAEPTLAETPARQEPVVAEPLRPAPDMMPAEPQADTVASAPSEPLQTATQPAEQTADAAAAVQQSIARIYDACKAPPISPIEYRALFMMMAEEITENQLRGVQTISNVLARAQEMGVELRREDVRFVLDVVSEPDPWFDQGASAGVFASRFRNFVVAQCQNQGLNLSTDELDMIQAWFVNAGQFENEATAPAMAGTAAAGEAPPTSKPQAAQTYPAQDVTTAQARPSYTAGNGSAPPAFVAASQQAAHQQATGEEFPRIVRNRLRN